MKIYLDNNLGVEKVEQEELTQDTYGYNILKVYIPNAVLAPYDTFTCYYGALLQNGRKVGWFAMEARTNSDADYEANYTLYKATLEQSVVSVEGKVYIGCQIILGNSGNATLIKKNTAVVQFNVRKSVSINNDILILDPEQTTTDVLESYKQLLENALTTYATKAQVQSGFAEVDSKLSLKADKSDTYTKAQIDTKLDLKSDKTYVDNALSEKADKSNTYTKSEVDSKLDLKANSDNVYSIGQVENLLYGKADKSDTYTKAEINILGGDLQGQIETAETYISNLRTETYHLRLDLDNLSSVQNVVDVVATYADLQSHDKDYLEENDKIQVIADETHDGASTIYNLEFDRTWKYIGAFGTNSYTKAEVDTKLSTKAEKDDTYTKQEVDGKLDGYIKNDDTTYSATVRGKEVIVSAGSGYGATTYKNGSIHTSAPRKPSCDYSFPDEKSGTLALTSDIPTVNNPTITFTQGGVTKGSISLNQASDQTIALDAGGSGGGSSVIANPTLSGDEATLNGLEVDGTKYKVGGGTITLENIVDSKGNNRFINNYGIWSAVPGMQGLQARWSLNGYNLMFEALGTFQTSVDPDTNIVKFKLPNWILNKIIAPVGNVVDILKFDIVSQAGQISSPTLYIIKNNEAIAFNAAEGVTLTEPQVFIIRYNLIIDSE